MRIMLGSSWLLAAAVAFAGGDVPIVTCPAEPPRVRNYELQELWRLDPAATETPLLGLIADAAAGPEGVVYLLDQQLSRVLVYDRDGRFLRAVGREGDGPGEFRWAGSLTGCGDDDIGVGMLFPPRVVCLHADGTPAGTWTCRDNGAVNGYARLDDGWLTVIDIRDNTRPDKSVTLQTVSLSSYDGDGRRAVTFLSSTYTTSFDPPRFDERASWFPERAWDVLASGEVVVAPERDRYRLEYFAPDGTRLRVVERPFRPHRRSDLEKEQIAAGVTQTDGKRTWRVESRVLETDAAVDRVVAQADGALRVYHSNYERDPQPGLIAHYDLHAADGTLVAEVRVGVQPPPGDFDRWFLLDDGRAVCVHDYVAAERNFWSGFASVDDGDAEAAAAQEEEALPLTVSCWRLVERPPR